MKYIRIENINLTTTDRQGLLKMLEQLPETTSPQQIASRQLIKELCTVKEQPTVTLTAQKFMAMLNRSDYVIER